MRVLLTRPVEDARRTAERLAARGHEAVLMPVTELVPTGAPMPPGPWDGLVLTSAHAVPALARFERRDLPVFAVGERTAAAAGRAGFGDVRTGAGDAEALAALILGSVAPGERLLQVGARDRKREPEASLRAGGVALTVWEVYEARAVSRLPPEISALLGAGRIDAALHYSRRSAALLVDLAERAGLCPSLRALAHLCLSADVAAPLLSIGARTSVAARPDETSLLAALDGIGTGEGSPSP